MPVETSTRLPAENRRHQIGERLSGAGARLGEQHAAVAERVGDGRSHLALRLTRLEVRNGRRERTVVSEDRGDVVGQIDDRPVGIELHVT